MLLDPQEKRLVQRGVNAYIYKGCPITDGVATLIAKSALDYVNDVVQRPFFEEIAYSGTVENLDLVLAAIDAELSKFSMDFREDVAYIQGLEALKHWAREKF